MWPLGVLTKFTTLIQLKFDTDYTDSSKFNHVFTPVGSPTLASGVLVLNGSSALITPDSATYDTPLTTGDFTIEARVRLTTLNTFCYIVNKVTSGNLPYALFIDSSNSLRFLGYSASGGGVFVSLSSTTGGYSISDNNFHHVAITRRGGIFTLFLDGILASTVTNNDIGNLVNSTEDLRIGSSSADGSGAKNFKGEIDWVRITAGVRYISSFTPPVSI